LSVIISSFVGIFPAQTSAIGPDTYGYTASATTFLFEDLPVPEIGAPPILDETDDAGVIIPIGFSFIFYGLKYNALAVTSNGTITFQEIETDWVPVDITKNAPNGDLPTLAVFWHDWTFQFFGSDAVHYATLGEVDKRRLVIQWNAAMSATGPGTDTVFFEAKLFEGSNNIEFHYRDSTISDDAAVSNGRNATVGIRDTGGQTSGRNLQWSFNQAVINDQTAIRFVAPAFKVLSISRLTNQHIVLQCTGAPSNINKIEATTDLKTTPFSFLGSATADSLGRFQYEDTTAGNFTRRFYRVGFP
jgi:hypothetical protein